MHCCDELYSKMRVRAGTCTCWLPAGKAPIRGTGRDEICLFTITYDKGRIFHTTLGHDVNSISCVALLSPFSGVPSGRYRQGHLTDVPKDFQRRPIPAAEP